jgi:sodium/proline symporter
MTLMILLSTIYIQFLNRGQRTITYAAAQFNATGKMFSAVLGWPCRGGVLAGTLIVLLYTVSGGFRAVAWTDVIQALLMIGAMVILPVVLLGELGGPQAA